MKQTELTIPSSQSEITLEQYMKLQEVTKGTDDENEINIAMVSILCNIPKQYVLGLNKNDYEDIVSELINTINQKSIWHQRFKIGKQEYGFLPNIDDMTLGEYVDLDTYMKDENMYGAMTILYRPIIKESFGRYLIEEYTGDEDTEIMKQCPLDAYHGALVFFWNLGNELLKAIPQYLEQQAAKDIQFKKTLEQNGDGIKVSMQSLKENLENSMKQHPIISTKL